jgi:hypothetical protein
VLYCRAYNGNGSNSLRRRCLYDRGVLIRSKVGSMFALISGHSCSVNSLSSSLAPSRAAGLERRSTARCRTMVSCQPLKKSGLQQNAATREPWSNARRRSPTCAEVVSDDTELAAPLRIQIPLPGAIAFRKMLGFPLRRHGRLQFPVACCLLPVACCLLPVACCLLPVACCLLPVACCLLPVAEPGATRCRLRDCIPGHANARSAGVVLRPRISARPA